MKRIVLGMLLTIVQAAPPVPRHTADKTSGSSQGVENQAGNKKTPAPSPTPTPEIVKPETQNNGADTPHAPNTKQPIAISELPPVSVEKDWMDKTAWVFGALLILVGVAGVWAAVKTLKTIGRQADLMDKQRIAMEGQLTTMQGQLAEIQKQAAEMKIQTSHLEDSVAAAKMSAEVAKKSADIAGRVSIPTLMIEKFESGDMGAADLEATLQFPKVNVVIKNHGQTPAFLRSWTIVFTCGKLPDVPDYSIGKSCGIVLDKDVIEPSGSYTIPILDFLHRTEIALEDVRAIIDHETLLWAYGFIAYYDLFGNPPWRFKFCQFALNFWAGGIEWVGGFGPEAYTGIEPMFLRTPDTADSKEK